MDRQEIKEWFDKAFEYLYQANFAEAAKSFQHVIDGDDIYAAQIARRDLHLCFPLQELVERLQSSSHPLSLTDLLQNGKYPRDFATHLRKFSSLYELDGEWWVADAPLRKAVKETLTKLLLPRQPITLALLVQNLFVDLGINLVVSPHLTLVLHKIIPLVKGFLLVESDCLFSEEILQLFATDLADLIRVERKPQSLRTAVAMTPWSESVTKQLDMNSLGQALRARRAGALSEIAPDFWVTQDLIDFSRINATAAFSDPYQALTTEELLLQLLLPYEHNIRLNTDYVRRQSTLLQANSTLYPVDTNLWLLRSLFGRLMEELFARFAVADVPIVPANLVTELADVHPGITRYAKSLTHALAARLDGDTNALQVSDTAWAHLAAFPFLLNRIYEGLVGHPRLLQELYADFIYPTVHTKNLRPEFRAALNSELHGDDRFLLDKSGYWHAIPPGNRLNNLAYWVLHGTHHPLTRQEIIRLAKEYRGRVVRFELVGDNRFKQVPDARWMIADWVWLNDLAASYLAATRTPQTRAWILKQVCAENGIEPEKAIFEPEGDARFIKDPFGRWLCTTAGTVLTREMLDHLVEDAINRLWGVPLEQLIRSAFNRPISDFLDLEGTILRDGRLIVCEGLWYPREAIHTLSLQDIQTIKSYLASRPFPVSSVELAQSCLRAPLCLTNLSDALRAESDLVQIGAAAWLLRTNESASIGRRREVNYPIHSGKYLPTMNPELLVEIDHTSISKRSENEGATGGLIGERPERVTIALTYEDIRDGSIVVSTQLRRFLDTVLDLPAFSFVDDSHNDFLSWYDAENNLIHGLRDWFRKHQLTFGEKIRFSRTRNQEKFLVETTGQRNEQAYREGLRHSQIEDWRQEAMRSDRSYHDLVLEVLDQFKAPLHIDDIYSLVDVRRTAKKNTISAILSSQSYFESAGRGYWRFNEQEYLKMIRELQAQVATLNQQKSELQTQIEERHGLIEENRSLRLQNSKLNQDLAATQVELREANTKFVGAQEVIRRLEGESIAWLPEQARLNRELAEALTAIQALRASLEERIAEIVTLRHDLADRNERLHSLETDLQKERQHIEELRVALMARDQDLEKVREEINRTEAELVKAHSAFLDQEEQNKVQGNELADTRAKLTNEQLRTEALQAELALQITRAEKMQFELEQIKQKLGHSLETTIARDSKIQSIEQMLSETISKLDKSQSREEQLDLRLDTLEELKSELQEQNTKLARDLALATSESASWQHKTQAAEALDAGWRVRYSKLEESLRLRETELEALTESRSTLEDDIARLRGERDIIARRNEQIAKDLDIISNQKAQLDLILNSRMGKLARWWTQFGLKGIN